MKSAEECRVLSVERRERAQRTSNEFLRRAFNDAANMWLQLMIEVASRETLKSQGVGCATNESWMGINGCGSRATIGRVWH
jgi:hypothetical protein